MVRLSNFETSRSSGGSSVDEGEGSAAEAEADEGVGEGEEAEAEGSAADEGAEGGRGGKVDILCHYIKYDPPYSEER